MRLHKISLRNLNSLYGDQSLDLDRDLEGANLFLIHGRTGAGKSTVMDAVSLALFGRTPRLDAQRGVLDADPSSIMSRGTWECRAEVEFSRLLADATRVRYRAVWSVHRARKRADGNLQNVEQSLERLGTDGQWGLLASGRKQAVYKAALDDALDGFTVEDFHRSMLLAQGRFDELLSALPNSRATILERLTNTENYRRIGMQAAELAAAHRKNIEFFRRQLGGTARVTPEELGLVQANLAIAHAGVERAKRQRDVAAAKLNWWKERQRLRAELDRLDSERRDLERRAEELGPTMSGLAEHARCSAGFVIQDRLQTIGTEFDRRSAEIDRGRARLTEMALAREQRIRQRAADEQAVKLAEGLLEELEAPHAQYSLAREAVLSLRKRLDGLRQRHAEAEAQHQRRAELLAQTAAELERAQQSETRAEAILAASASARPLRDFWKSHGHAQSIAFETEHRRLEQETKEQELTAERFTFARNEIQARINEHIRLRKNRLSEPEAAVSRWRVRLSEVIGSEEPKSRMVALRERSSEAQRQISALEGAQRELLAREALESKQQQATARLSDAERAAGAASEVAASTRRVAADLALRSSAAEKQRHRLELVAQIFLRREALRHGEACPLCGSKQHPYLDEPAICPDESVVQHELTEARRECELLLKQAAEAELVARDAERTAEKHSHERATLFESCSSLAADLEASASLVDRAQRAAGLPGDCRSGGCNERLIVERSRLENLLTELHAVEEASDSLDRARQELERVQQALAAEEKTLSAKSIEIEARLQGLAERLTTLETDRRRLDTATSEFRSVLQGIAPEWSTSQSIGSLALTELRQRVDAEILALDEAEQALTVEQNQLQALLQQKTSQTIAFGDAEKLLASLLSELQDQNSEYQAICERGRALLEEMRRIWGARARDEVAVEAAPDALQGPEIIEQARQNLARLRHNAGKSREAAESAIVGEEQQQGMLKALLSAQAAVEHEREEAQQELSRQLSQLGFDTEGALLARRMHPDALRDAQTKVSELQQQQQAWQIRHEERRQTLEQHQAAIPLEFELGEPGAGEPLGTLVESQLPKDLETSLPSALAQAEEEVTAANEQEREALFRLEDAKRRQREFAQAGDALVQAEARARTWLQLDALIGTRNGDAFKEYAQGLNLHRLVTKANVHLQRLSERYQLTQARVDGMPTLEFAIKDLWQGGMPRSTRTLSGGERFLVSLALALGLSDLRVQRLPIETLILDEGFGTLDPETLEIALSALQRLHADGRQVGVISHVEGLKLKIPAQVRIVEEGGGRSRIVVGQQAG